MKNQRVMIVDDERLNLEVLAEELNRDYEIILAKSGEQALERLKKTKIDLILLDIKMPGMSGYEVCRQLKEKKNTRDIPIIFFTAMSQIEDEARGLSLGAVDYITKPFSLPIVKARVKTHLELKRKTEILKALASLDGLTNIPNRRRFDEQLHFEWKRAKRTESYLGLIFVDIDYFKKFNDNYGHPAGDACLRKVADGLQITLKRPSDFLARYGGEEFVALLPSTNLEGSQAVAQNLQKTIENLAIPHEYSPVADQVTISIGVASFQPYQFDESPMELVKAADQMLFQAKREGRNAICLYRR